MNAARDDRAIIARVLKAVLFIVTLAWLALILYAQSYCSIFKSFGNQCHDERGDIWMLPFFAAVIGLPATLISLIVILTAAVRSLRERGL
jgi:hypothetical protein